MKPQTKLKFVNTPPKNVTVAYTEGEGKFSIPAQHLLTPHWHPNSNEITTCTQGEGTVTIIAPGVKASGNPATATTTTYSFKAGDSVFLQQGYFHYFVNTGTDDFIIDLTFDEEDFDILTLSKTLSLLPENIKLATIYSNPDKNPVIPYENVDACKEQIAYSS